MPTLILQKIKMINNRLLQRKYSGKVVSKRYDAGAIDMRKGNARRCSGLVCLPLLAMLSVVAYIHIRLDKRSKQFRKDVSEIRNWF